MGYCRSEPEVAAESTAPSGARARRLIVAALLLAVPSAPASSGEGTIEVGTGYATESLVDPTVGLAAVPGGSFVHFSPSGSLARPLGARSLLAFSGSASFEQFFDEGSRRQLGAAALGELTVRSAGRLYGRFSLGGQLFRDSDVDGADRNGGEAQAILGRSIARGGLELGLGGWQRGYPNLDVVDQDGSIAAYEETTAYFSVAAFGRLGRSLLLRGEVDRRTTDARDPLYDALSWYFRGDARWNVGAAWTTWLTALYQRRDFDERPTGEDRDDYLQLGLRLERALGGNRRLALQYALAAYGQPDGDGDETHRAGVYLSWRFGGRAAAREPAASSETVFRIRRPGAQSVSVVGDFNGWNPARHAMRDAGGGWWELTIELPPGSYQYVYVVDGEPVTPPDAATTIDDGFGGRNGLLRIPETAVTSVLR